MSDSDVTLVNDAIHNPSEPRHFMQVVPTSRQIATAAGQVIADSTSAVVVKEVGHNIYDPIVYFPRADVDMAALRRIDKSTHCPLKGDTEYFDVITAEGKLDAAAWSYVKMTLGDELFELVAFDPSQISVDAAS